APAGWRVLDWAVFARACSLIFLVFLNAIRILAASRLERGALSFHRPGSPAGAGGPHRRAHGNAARDAGAGAGRSAGDDCGGWRRRHRGGRAAPGARLTAAEPDRERLVLELEQRAFRPVDGPARLAELLGRAAG